VGRPLISCLTVKKRGWIDQASKNETAMGILPDSANTQGKLGIRRVWNNDFLCYAAMLICS
jgi:hypothetical protein